jgi:uncharacterized protein (DUF983 family)
VTKARILRTDSFSADGPTSDSSPPPVFATLLRGLRRRCPRCGRGRLFRGAFKIRERCKVCDLDFLRYAHDTWAMIYFSTAGLTGLVVVALITARPANLLLGRLTLGIVAAAVIVASLPSRKGAAVAVNWLVSVRGDASSDDTPPRSAADKP